MQLFALELAVCLRSPSRKARRVSVFTWLVFSQNTEQSVYSITYTGCGKA